ncbi:N-acetyltransferase [Alteromonadaceae bacterium M269]|nr:N-acetyltransferase [Alteromonadaceae bacterium M269]
MNLTLAIATEKDKEFFWKHYRESMRRHIEQIWGWDEQWQSSDFETRWADCKNRIIRDGNTDIGYIQTVDLAEEHYIMMLIILPEFRSKGIGRRLLDEIRSSTQTKCIGLRVFRTNFKALRFYQSQGFRNVTNEDNFYYLKQDVL